MKIRLDYVTNSSSSSFIIGKKDQENVTVESVYQTVRELYINLLENKEKLKKHIDETNGCDIALKTTCDKNSNEHIEEFYYVGDLNWDEKSKKDEHMMKKYGFDTFTYFYPEQDEWISCETYRDYEKYWRKKAGAPFTITDFSSDRDVLFLHNGEVWSHKEDSSYKSWILAWFFPYAIEAFEHPDNCNGCECAELCDKKECLSVKDKYAKTVPKDKACLFMLGKICVHSESGFMYDSVVKELEKKSIYSCNHMG